MIKVTKYLFILILSFMLFLKASADDLGTGKGGNFKKETFAKDNFNKSGEGLIVPNPNSGAPEGNGIPIGGGVLILIFGGIIYFSRRIGSDLKKDQDVNKLLF